MKRTVVVLCALVTLTWALTDAQTAVVGPFA